MIPTVSPQRVEWPKYRYVVIGILLVLALGSIAFVVSRSSAPITAKDPDSVPSGADPSVSAQMGGEGFDRIAESQGWQTGSIPPEEFIYIADSAAVKGGEFNIGIEQFPLTFRAYGRDENVQETRMVYSMVYEGLLMVNPLTLDFLPSLASHWKIDSGGRTFHFRIDPNARFSDGHPVTSDDVIATWQLGIDSGIVSESTNQFFNDFERPVALSRYIVSVTARNAGWKNLLYFGGTSILPAHIIGKISGSEYIERYQYRMPPGSGPYILADENPGQGESITLRRRTDWWGRGMPQNRGQYNFDRIRMILFDNDSAALDAFRTGRIDFSSSAYVQNNIDRVGVEEINRGMLRSRKIYNDAPVGFSGLAFNTERAPFDDIRVREAITLLFDREKYIATYQDEIPELSSSIYPGSVFANPRNPEQKYDRQAAMKLLAEAGYDSRDSRGALVRDGLPFEIEMLIYPGQEWVAEMLAEELIGQGIVLTTRTLDGHSWFSMLKERNYTMALMSWGGLIYPNPETSFHSSLADYSPSNNITAFRNERVDTLIAREKRSFDAQERKKILREIDSIFTAERHYAYTWHVPYSRLVHTNRFGMPAFVLGRLGDWRDMLSLWWVDPQKEKQLAEALENPSTALENDGRVEDRFWQEWNGTREAEEQARGADPISGVWKLHFGWTGWISWSGKSMRNITDW